MHGFTIRIQLHMPLNVDRTATRGAGVHTSSSLGEGRAGTRRDSRWGPRPATPSGLLVGLLAT